MQGGACQKSNTPPHAFFTPRQPADSQRFGFWKLDLGKKKQLPVHPESIIGTLGVTIFDIS